MMSPGPQDSFCCWVLSPQGTAAAGAIHCFSLYGFCREKVSDRSKNSGLWTPSFRGSDLQEVGKWEASEGEGERARTSFPLSKSEKASIFLSPVSQKGKVIQNPAHSYALRLDYNETIRGCKLNRHWLKSMQNTLSGICAKPPVLE